jgi:AraC-like DNA-binding protein
LPVAHASGILLGMETFTVAAVGVRAMVEGFRALGLDVPAILADAEVSAACLDDAEFRIPEVNVMSLWLSAERRWTEAGRELLGLHTGANVPLGALDVLDYLVGTSTTLGDAFNRLAEYQVLVSSGMKYVIGPVGAETAVTITHPFALDLLPPSFLEYMWALVVTRFRTRLSEAFRPRLELRHRPQGSRDVYRAVLGHVEFEKERDALFVPREQWKIENPHHNAALSTILERHAREVAARVPRAETPVERIHEAIAESLRDGEPGIEQIASRMALSVRSLQRQLAAEGTSFKSALAHVRARLARTYLVPNGPSLAEVSHLLGYSEPSAFHRAFRRWTGVTPLEYRTAIRDD